MRDSNRNVAFLKGKYNYIMFELYGINFQKNRKSSALFPTLLEIAKAREAKKKLNVWEKPLLFPNEIIKTRSLCVSLVIEFLLWYVKIR